MVALHIRNNHPQETRRTRPEGIHSIVGAEIIHLYRQFHNIKINVLQQILRTLYAISEFSPHALIIAGVKDQTLLY